MGNMHWEQESESQWSLLAYYGDHKIATVTQDSNGDFWLNAGKLIVDELLLSETLDEAMYETYDSLENAFQGESSYFNEIIAIIKELRDSGGNS